MRYSLEKFSNIPQDTIQSLSDNGITNSDQLLNRAATPDLRKKITQQLAFPYHQFLETQEKIKFS